MTNRLLAFVILLVGACSLDLPDDAVRPVDEYCLPGTCTSDKLCFDGDCYSACEHDDDCATGCCKDTAENIGSFCASARKCE